jgi:hypothetical protein
MTNTQFAAMYMAAQAADTSQKVLEAAHEAVEGVNDRATRARVLTPAFALAELISTAAWAEYSAAWAAEGERDWTTAEEIDQLCGAA